ncbi:beta-Ala-His dipeptidase [Spirochaeta isovalerica]|uniref:Cytosol non-specific dipeptidase n=1 Tax=Spirochaeta isovalerica TaxID=150 RepID=A0A841RBF7_9SPIO|nr:beta-Ala-His dipeptidase [Spirochaeta isovalerica]MBB6480577.1 dipeptidase D [Spirochaeta isovalerica]
MSKNYTQQLLDQLEDINRIPRKSGNRGPITEYFKKWAAKQGFACREDHVQNLVIEVPGTKGYENSPVVVLQGHTDMVCEKTPESAHDFSKDPIEHVIEGDWLTAKDTSLGADNGIGLAMAMVAATDDAIAHPPLELLFTTDEEVGLWGADEIKPDFFKGRIMINLDSEELGIFTLGCAGSVVSHIDYKMETTGCARTLTGLTLKVGGFRGGHSGQDIHKERANATAELIRGLEWLSRETPIRIASLSGGSAMNAISRSAEALIVVPGEKKNAVETAWSQFGSMIAAENNVVETSAFGVAKESAVPEKAFSEDDSRSLVEKLRLVPHGVLHMNAELPEQLETSLNFGVLLTTEKGIRITTMQRSAVKSRLQEITDRVETFARITGGKYTLEIFSDPWQPDWKSPLVAKSCQIWEDMFKKKPLLEVTHGGLECGVIGNLIGGMDMISFGPDIEDPHSPDEKLRISSVEPVFGFLIKLLEELK